MLLNLNYVLIFFLIVYNYQEKLQKKKKVLFCKLQKTTFKLWVVAITHSNFHFDLSTPKLMKLLQLPLTIVECTNHT